MNPYHPRSSLLDWMLYSVDQPGNDKENASQVISRIDTTRKPKVRRASIHHCINSPGNLFARAPCESKGLADLSACVHAAVGMGIESVTGSSRKALYLDLVVHKRC